MRHLDLFSGIGGFALSASRVWPNHEVISFCENNEWCRKILKKHWPTVPIISDIRKMNGKAYTNVDLLTGGFPCQDLSCAGRQDGINGERSGLWVELCRVISEVQPQFAILENVTNLLAGDDGRWFGRVLGDLAEIGFNAWWNCIPASYFGFPHQRDRVFILAYPASLGWNLLHNKTIFKNKRNGFPDRKQSGYRWRCKNGGHSLERVGWDVTPSVCRSYDGIPEELDEAKNRLKGLGNAIVPQVAETIMRAIKDAISKE